VASFKAEVAGLKREAAAQLQRLQQAEVATGLGRIVAFY
jgi:hypothetical protein